MKFIGVGTKIEKLIEGYEVKIQDLKKVNENSSNLNFTLLHSNIYKKARKATTNVACL